MGVQEQSSPGAEEILHAAKDLFAERGFEAVSISAIAERAGSCKANIFHHFGNKEGLYTAVMRSVVDRATAQFQQAAAESEVSARIESAIRGSLSVMFEDPERARLVFREVMEAGPSRGKALAHDLFSGEFVTLTQLFADAQEQGRCALRVEPGFLAFLLLSANLMMFHSRHMLQHLPGGDFAVNRDQYVAMLRDVLMQSMVPPEGDRE